MNFKESRNLLETVFNKNGFSMEVAQKKVHTKEKTLQKCSNGTEILVSFPGYKAFEKSDGGLVYDYRIDIKKAGLKTALSHSNLIVDIYNKIINGGLFALGMSNALIELSKESTSELSDHISTLPYKSVKPPITLIKQIKNAHKDKSYNLQGNSFDLTLEELFCSIKWIVIQEDINYPISKGFEGRRMAFARYLETVFVTQNNRHSLMEVIERTLSHKRPSPWPEMDYDFLKNIY